MRTSPTSEINDVRAVDVTVTEEELRVDLEDGRTLVVPLAWYPRLVHGSPAERNHGVWWGGDTSARRARRG